MFTRWRKKKIILIAVALDASVFLQNLWDYQKLNLESTITTPMRTAKVHLLSSLITPFVCSFLVPLWLLFTHRSS